MSEYIDYHMGDYLGEYILDIRDDDSGLIKEKITRCRDCKQYTDEQDRRALNEPEGFYCKRFSYWDGNRDVTYYEYMEPDGFCKWGERRAEQ